MPPTYSALVAVSSDDIALADAFSAVDVASKVAYGAQLVAGACLTSAWVQVVEVPESGLAVVTPTTLNIFFAVTSTCLHVHLCLSGLVTKAVIFGTARVAVALCRRVRGEWWLGQKKARWLTLTDVWVFKGSLLISEVVWFASFAVVSHCVMLTVVTDAACLVA